LTDELSITSTTKTLEVLESVIESGNERARSGNSLSYWSTHTLKAYRLNSFTSREELLREVKAKRVGLTQFSSF